MKKDFSFLKDERAMHEIKKHKWIESERANREVGFATSALDWIKRFGEAWKKIHLRENKDYNRLIERRKFRRYKKDFVIELNKGNANIRARVKELSFTGVLCYSKEYIPISQEVLINFRFQDDNENDKSSYIKCRGVVNRVTPVSSQEYEIFLRFDEVGQRYIEDSLIIF